MKTTNIDFYDLYFKKASQGSRYNFALEPLLKNFSFLDFTDEAFKTDGCDHGAFLIITGKQYVIGYTSSFGLGSHQEVFSRAYKDLYGGGEITSRDSRLLSTKCENDFLVSRIMFEQVMIDSKLTYNGSIFFMIPKDGITQEQFAVFDKFYEDFNREIELTVFKYGIDKFKVSYRVTDEYGHNVTKFSHNLDSFREYLKNFIRPNKILNDEKEVIIGTEVINSKKKR